MHASAQRLYEAARELKDVSGQSAVARLLNESPQTLKNWEARGVSKQGALNAETIIGCSATWIRTGDGQLSGGHAWQPIRSTPAPTAMETPYLPGFQELSIPVLAQSGSMGVGNELMSEEVVVRRLTVSPDWVSRTVKPTALENLRFIHGYGDSMDPTFSDGDVLLVDVGITDPKIDGVYVLEANERIYIKRVRQRMDGTFEISSDNPTVKTVDILDGRQQVKVCGRVVWTWNGKKI